MDDTEYMNRNKIIFMVMIISTFFTAAFVALDIIDIVQLVIEEGIESVSQLRPFAVISVAIFIAFAWWRDWRLNAALRSRAPNIKLMEAFVNLGNIISDRLLVQSSKGETTKIEDTYFAHVRYANKPKIGGTEKNHANNVVALLTYYDLKGNVLGSVDIWQ